MSAGDEYFGDGYCDCCRQFHLLKHHEVPALDQAVSICRYCADLGDLEIAWRIGGICEDGSYGYEHAPDRLKRPGRRMRRDPLAEALMLDDPGPIEIRRLPDFAAQSRQAGAHRLLAAARVA